MSKLIKACENMRNEMDALKEVCKKRIIEEDLMDDPETMVMLAHSFKLTEACEEVLGACAEEMVKISRGIDVIIDKLDKVEKK